MSWLTDLAGSFDRAVTPTMTAATVALGMAASPASELSLVGSPYIVDQTNVAAMSLAGMNGKMSMAMVPDVAATLDRMGVTMAAAPTPVASMPDTTRAMLENLSPTAIGLKNT